MLSNSLLFDKKLEEDEKILITVCHDILTSALTMPKVLTNIIIEYSSIEHNYFCRFISFPSRISRIIRFGPPPALIIANNIPIFVSYEYHYPDFFGDIIPTVMKVENDYAKTKKTINALNDYSKLKRVITSTFTQNHIHVISRYDHKYEITSFSTIDGKISKTINLNDILISRFGKDKDTYIIPVKFFVDNGVIYIGVYSPNKTRVSNIIAFDDKKTSVVIYNQNRNFRKCGGGIEIMASNGLDPRRFVATKNKIFMQDYFGGKINIYDIKRYSLDTVSLFPNVSSLTSYNKDYVLGLNIQNNEQIYMFFPITFSAYVLDLNLNVLQKIILKSDEQTTKIFKNICVRDISSFYVDGEKLYFTLKNKFLIVE